MLRALFGADHPYRLPVDGDLATVAELSADDLRAFHRARYVAGNAACVVAGDVDPDAVVAMLDARLNDWSGRAEPAPEFARPAPSRAALGCSCSTGRVRPRRWSGSGTSGRIGSTRTSPT